MPKVQLHAEKTSQPRLDDAAFIARDGAHLPYRSWLPGGEPSAVIVGLHGFNDYSHAFELPGEYMALHGVATYAYDQRGFGIAPERGIWAGPENLGGDAADMVTVLRERYPTIPIFLLGESMGGAVAVTAVTSPGFPKINGVILSAPAIWGGETMSVLFRVSLWGLSHTFPDTLLTGKDLHILASDNIEMLRMFAFDSRIIKETRADAIWGLLKLMDMGYDRIGGVKVPMLLLYGAQDQVIPKDPIRQAIKKMPAGAKTAYYPLGFHMLLRDLHGDFPVRDMLSWINNPAAELPSKLDAWAVLQLEK